MNAHTSNVTSRRRFLATAGLAAGTAVIARRQVYAETDGSKIVQTMLAAAASAKITVLPIRRNISVLDGSGGNIAVLTGKDGKVLIDAGYSVTKSGIKSALASSGSEPIRHLINTHWHADHTDGNAWLHDEGAAILAHENTRKRLSVPTRVEGWEHTFPAAPAGAIPAAVFRDRHQVRLNDTGLLLKYYGPAHTDSDISVNFTEADVLHVGDTWWNGIYPFIDYSTGGSIDGTIRAAEANIAAVTPQTIVIPGHGAPGGKSDLIAFRDMLVEIRAKVAALKKQGRSLADVVAARPTAPYDARWGQFLITPRFFTTLVFQGV
jgi:glyoxylase-like metal-dependent hydrolase (beta-lactamase superfamily II)